MKNLLYSNSFLLFSVALTVLFIVDPHSALPQEISHPNSSDQEAMIEQQQAVLNALSKTVIVRDKSNSTILVTPTSSQITEIQQAIKGKLDNESIPISIFVQFRIDKSNDIFGDMEIWYASACTVSAKGTPLTTSEGAPIFVEGVRVNQVIKLSRIITTTASKDIDKIDCTVKFIEDDGLTNSQKEAADKLSKDLKAYFDVAPASKFVEFVPLLPMFIGLSDVMFSDEELHTASITLLKSKQFLPATGDLSIQGASTQTTWQVEVDNYQFAGADAFATRTVELEDFDVTDVIAKLDKLDNHDISTNSSSDHPSSVVKLFELYDSLKVVSAERGFEQPNHTEQPH